MDQLLKLELPNYNIFDFHRHVSNQDVFNKNLSQFRITEFCIMPSMIEGDFSDVASYINKIKPFFNNHEEKPYVFGFIDFQRNLEENRQLIEQQKKELNIIGIKLHPEQGFELEKHRLTPLFKLILDILGTAPIYIHMDWPLRKENRFAPNGKKATFNKMASFFPEFTFIMGHAGGSGDYLNVWKTCKKYSNVYIETSMAPSTSPLEEVVGKIGADKLLFGSNFPYCATSVEIVKILNLYQVSNEEKQQILSQNWREVLKK